VPEPLTAEALRASLPPPGNVAAAAMPTASSEAPAPGAESATPPAALA